MLAEQLNDTEFIQFMTRIVTRYGRSILLKSISNQITGTRTSQLDVQSVNELISAIKEIINARWDEAGASIASKVALDVLPAPLIGEISSYLQQTELGSFCQSSRAIFVGCSEYVCLLFNAGTENMHDPL